MPASPFTRFVDRWEGFSVDPPEGWQTASFEGHRSDKVDSGYEAYREKDDVIVGSSSADLDAHLLSGGFRRMKVF